MTRATAPPEDPDQHSPQPCRLSALQRPPELPPICEVVERALLDTERGVDPATHRAHAYGLVGIRIDPSNPANTIVTSGAFPHGNLPDGQSLEQFMLTMLAVSTLEGMAPETLRRVAKLVRPREGSLLDVLVKLNMGELDPSVS